MVRTRNGMMSRRRRRVVHRRRLPLKRATARAVRRIATRVVNRRIETKTLQYHESSFQQDVLIANTGFFINLIGDLNNGAGLAQGVSENNRIGDVIHVRGIKLRMSLTNFNTTLNLVYNDRQNVAIRVVVFGTKDTAPTNATLFRNGSYAPVQNVDTDQNRIILDRQFTFRTTLNSVVASTAPARNQMEYQLWIPGTKLGHLGRIRFQDNSVSTLLGFNYFFAIFASAVNDTGNPNIDLLWNGAIYYKDA